MTDICQPLLHDRDKTVSTGDNAGIIAPFTQQTDNPVNAVWAVVIKRSWNHSRTSPFFDSSLQITGQ
jgi:hypothetical protein